MTGSRTTARQRSIRVSLMHAAKSHRGPCTALRVPTPRTKAEIDRILWILDHDTETTVSEWLEAFDALCRAAYPELDVVMVH